MGESGFEIDQLGKSQRNVDQLRHDSQDLLSTQAQNRDGGKDDGGLAVSSLSGSAQLTLYSSVGNTAQLFAVSVYSVQLCVALWEITTFQETWAHGLMGPCHGPKEPWAHAPMGPWALGPMDPWAHGCMGPWAHRPMGPWAHGPMTPWAHGPMGHHPCQ